MKRLMLALVMLLAMGLTSVKADWYWTWVPFEREFALRWSLFPKPEYPVWYPPNMQPTPPQIPPNGGNLPEQTWPENGSDRKSVV